MLDANSDLYVFWILFLWSIPFIVLAAFIFSLIQILS